MYTSKLGIICGLCMLTSLQAFPGISRQTANAEELPIAAAMAKKEAPAKKEEINEHGTAQPNLPGHLSHPGFFFNVDFLYWNAKVSNLDFGIQHPAGTTAAEVASSHLKVLRPDFKWKPGFRVGAGYLFSQDLWDLYLNWTHLHSDASKSASGGLASDAPLGSIYPSWIPLVMGFAGTTHASSHWDMSFNVLELELGRSFFLSRKVVLRPHVGLQGALIHQNYKASYAGVYNPVMPNPTVFRNSSFHAKNNFNGIGLRFGADTIWHFTKNWNLFGKIAGSLVEGKFDVKEKANGFVVAGLTPYSAHYNFSEWLLEVDVQGALGFGWETFYHQDKYHFALNVSYEFQQWFSQNQLVDLTAAATNEGNSVQQPLFRNGDLSLQGLTVEARFDF